MDTETTTKQASVKRLTVLVPLDDVPELERRAAEERLKVGPHVRRLIVQDAKANPAPERNELPAAA